MAGNSFAIFGLGVFGAFLAQELSRSGNHVTAVDINPDRINDISSKVTEAVVADVSSEEVIRELEVSKFSAVILCMSSHFESQLLALTLLKQENVSKVYVKAGSILQQRILCRLGADEIIQPEQSAAERLSRRLSLDNITDFVEFKGSAIAEVSVPEDMIGKSLRQLDLRNRSKINVLMIQKAHSAPESVWSPDAELEAGDMLTVFGDKRSMVEVFHLKK